MSKKIFYLILFLFIFISGLMVGKGYNKGKVRDRVVYVYDTDRVWIGYQYRRDKVSGKEGVKEKIFYKEVKVDTVFIDTSKVWELESGVDYVEGGNKLYVEGVFSGVRKGFKFPIKLDPSFKLWVEDDSVRVKVKRRIMRGEVMIGIRYPLESFIKGRLNFKDKFIIQGELNVNTQSMGYKIGMGWVLIRF